MPAPECIAVLHHWTSAVKADGFAWICSNSVLTVGIEAGKSDGYWHTQIWARPSL